MDDIAIISTCRGHEDYLNANIRLMELCEHEDFTWSWTVARDADHPWSAGGELDPRFNVIEHVSPPAEDVNGIGWASLCTAAGLNKAFRYAPEARYLLALDCDFFLVPHVSTILAHMKDRGLDVFGCPYAKSRRNVVRNVPVAFCMFIDLGVIDWQIDFSPGFRGLPATDEYPDVGYSLYKEMEHLARDIAVPSVSEGDFRRTKETIQSRYGIDSGYQKMDAYFWHRRELFALHVRAKMHATRFRDQSPEQRSQDARERIAEVERILKHVAVS